MNVLFVSSSFPTREAPGHCPYNLKLCQALSHFSNTLAIVPVPWFSAGMRAVPPPLAETGSLHIKYPKYFHVPWVGRGWQAVGMERSIQRELTQASAGFRPDWILSYWTFPDSSAAGRVARRLGCPSIAMVGGSDVLRVSEGTAAWRRASRTLRSADHVIAVSHDLISRIRSMGVDDENITLMPRGLDRELFRAGDRATARAKLGIPERVPVLLWVGRLVPVKNLGMLIRAVDALRHRHSNFLLYLVGEGPERELIQGAITRRGLAAWARVVGAEDPERLPLWYQAADIVVLPSLSEGTPNVLLEAQACGRRFVASRVGGIPDLAGDSDVLVEPGDESELVAGLFCSLSEEGDPHPPSSLDSWDGVARVISLEAEGLLKR